MAQNQIRPAAAPAATVATPSIAATTDGTTMESDAKRKRRRAAALTVSARMSSITASLARAGYAGESPVMVAFAAATAAIDRECA